MIKQEIKKFLKKAGFTDEEIAKMSKFKFGQDELVTYVEREHYTDNRESLNKEVVQDTVKFAKKYGFEIGSGEHSTWNNEADAFKHAYMQALLTLRDGGIKAFGAGVYHELETRDYFGTESEMDRHNNGIGREVAQEYMKKQKSENINSRSEEVKEDIARLIIERMNNEKLILDPFGRRTLKKKIDLDKITGSSMNSKDKNDLNSSNVTSRGCAGTYKVSGYTRMDGVDVRSYWRTCGARHKDPAWLAEKEKYAKMRFQDIPKEGIRHVVSFFV